MTPPRPTMRLLVAVSLVSLFGARAARAEPPNGPGWLRVLGPRAQSVLEPQASTIGAVVRVPEGLDLASVGLRPLSPGFAKLRGTASELLEFAGAHPELPLEVAPPPHLLLNLVGQWTHALAARAATDGTDGAGALIGVADTGIDFSLGDFMDPATGHTRIAWLLDMTLPEGGHHPILHADLEAAYGGAVYSGADLDNFLGTGFLTPASAWLTDDVGHGTHVASIAAGNGGLAQEYVGLAPAAQLLIARITRDASESIATSDLLTGAQFLFDRADAMHKPIAVNLSIGSDFGPHDGTLAWEQALAAFVGPSSPGHAFVAAAGNSGDITLQGVHASVFVPPGGKRSVPIYASYGGTTTGQIQVWVAMRAGASLSVGLDTPTGTWLTPVAPGTQSGTPDASYQASIYNGSAASDGMIPSGSHGAIVLWGGQFAAGNYAITLEGTGVADLYVEGAGDAVDLNGSGVGFVNPVREGTINIPATNAGLIAVGCTVNRGMWTSIDNGPVSITVSPLDPRGGYAADSGAVFPAVSGDVCWFSSAGPTVTGVPKPEISAPGGVVIAAMSQWALPSGPSASPDSIFNNSGCPSVLDGGPSDPSCMVVDSTHAVAAGTSMSAPQAAGVAALLFQRDPTLTQDKIVGLLQAGAHPFRTGTPRFEDQGGPGEIDVQGSLDALEEMKDPTLALPSRSHSWLTLSADEVAADGSTPLTVIVELRTADGAHRPYFFDANRLAPTVALNGALSSHPPPLQRRAPGLWVFTVTPPPGLGGQRLTVGATFDGEPIVASKTVAIATDVWTENYPSSARGSCRASPRNADGREGLGACFIAAIALGWRGATRPRARRPSRAAPRRGPPG